MAEKYPIQFNVKVGDHLINVNGETVENALLSLETVADHYAEIHTALSILDGRPATEIVQKEKTWGARSQGGRTYPKPAVGGAPHGTATGGSASHPTQTGQQSAWGADPVQVAQQELGATVVSTEQNVASVSAGAVPHEVMVCPLHGPRRYAGPGVSQAGKEYGASYRCSERSCATGPHGKNAVWQNKDGSWPRAGA